MQPIEDRNPRLQVVLDELQLNPVKTIVWCRFRHEVLAVAAAYQRSLDKGNPWYPVVYHGMLDSDSRWENVRAFQEDPNCRLFVATPDTAARGLDLFEARHTIFYSCSFNYEHRIQAEDRMHRHGFTGRSATYTDLVAPGTVDEKIVQDLQRKGETADAFQWGGVAPEGS